MNPFAGLLLSRKFWTLILDTVISTVILVGGWYLSPDTLDRVVAVIAIYQPVFIALIAAIASEDNAERKFKSSVRDSELSWEYYKVQAEKEKAEQEIN